MKYFIIFLTLIFEVHEYSSLSVINKPPLGIIQSHGYPAEAHSVFTEDDYELILHRIPYGTNCKRENGTRTPVILQHGIYEGSQIWLFLGPDNALGFLLADNCYDVWLGNSRGNCASRGHKYLNTSQPKYWDFSYHEMGVYDLKAVVDYIVDVTKQDEVLYIGYSQGSTVGLVNAMYYPDNKIKAYFLLAPIAYYTYNPSILRALYPFEPLLTALTQHVTGNFELRFNIEPLKMIEKIICSAVPEFCYIPLFMCGVDPLHVNRTALPDQLLESCGISTKQLFHYLQGYYLDLFQFNYDPLTNIKKYGSKRPPAYDINKINKPMYIYHSPSDLCGDLKDVEKLKEKLGDNLVKIHLVENPSFDHLGFAFNNNVKELVYDTLISDMLKFLS